jgi:hypothetical protein
VSSRSFRHARDSGRRWARREGSRMGLFREWTAEDQAWADRKQEPGDWMGEYYDPNSGNSLGNANYIVGPDGKPMVAPPGWAPSAKDIAFRNERLNYEATRGTARPADRGVWAGTRNEANVTPVKQLPRSTGYGMGPPASAPPAAPTPTPAPLPTAAGQPWNRPANGLPGGQFAPGAAGQGFSTVKPGGTAPAPGAPPPAAGGVSTPPVGAAARAPGTGAPPAPGFPGVKPIAPPRPGLGTRMGGAGMR